MSLRKRAAKSLIARRAFFFPPLVRLNCTACIPACDSTFSKFNRITVYFCRFSLSCRTFPRMKNARPCDFCSRFIRGQPDLFALCSRDCAFSAQFQRKFSANHAKSAYFQRKSRKVSVNNHLPYIIMPAHLWKATVGGHSAFSDGLEPFADDLA